MAKDRERLLYTFQKEGDTPKKRYLHIDSRIVVAGITLVVCLVLLVMWPLFRYYVAGYITMAVPLGLITISAHLFYFRKKLRDRQCERWHQEYVDRYG